MVQTKIIPRKISADYVFPIDGPPVEKGVVVLDDKGTVLSVGNRQDFRPDELELHQGILCPGFINAHCHLELSGFKGKIPEGGGLLNFVEQMVEQKKTNDDQSAMKAISEAEQEMIDEGIVAVGDISNDSISFSQKAKGRLRYHTFIEIYDLDPSVSHSVFERSVKLYESVPGKNGSAKSITPHAPYTCSPDLLLLISDFADLNQGAISIHMQESREDDRLYRDKKGQWLELMKQWGYKMEWVEGSEKTSMQGCLKHFDPKQRIISVHNTYTTQDDIDWATERFEDISWCICPNANLYIEQTIPDLNLFRRNELRIAVGTDSYASNWSLSILDELKVISERYTEIPLEEMLTWATLNGAIALGFDYDLGSIKPGKSPGLNLIKNINLDRLTLGNKAEVEKIL